MNSLISWILAIITAFSGLTQAASLSAAESFFTDAFSLLVQRSDFIDDINDSDISVYGESAGFVDNTVLVFFEENASFFSKLDALKKSDGVTVGSLPEMNLCVVRTSDKTLDELLAFCDELTMHEAVALASICPAHKLDSQYTPDDPFTNSEWYEEKWSEVAPNGNNWWLEAVDARGAWGYNSLYGNIDIGIVDGGFDTDHVELDGKIRFPDSKSASRNRDNSHGTHVAGIIAAEGDNGVGICGLCQNAELICLDWTPSDGQLWIADIEIFFGFTKVAKAGAKVINFSLGSSSSISDYASSMPGFINNLDAMLYSYAMGSLLSKGYDFIVVQSAGNGNAAGYAVNASQNGVFCSINEGNTFLPFIGVGTKDILDRIIIVGSAALDKGGFVQSSSSNVGEIVDICAPGVMVYSCVQDDSYQTKSGTSMATPVVTAVASLVWSVNPDLTAAQVKQIVCENTCATVDPSEERYFANAGYRAYPMVNAKLAVEAALLMKSNTHKVSFSGIPAQTVTFTNAKGDEFVFETSMTGELECVLPQGEYKVSHTGVDITVTVDKDVTIGG